ncbi:MAG: hypothetical protein KGZ74_12445 [Chitinophagaceae bacterium]|nr:hypothetical protein [Chitinophagaceae bacterium]
MKRRSFLWEFLAYTFYSAKTLLLKGHWYFFVTDMRHFFNWRSSRRRRAETLHVQTPWMVFEAIEFLKGWLTKDMKVYEYGSGSSTLFFSNLCDSIISVEHYDAWYCKVRDAIKKHGLHNIEYRLLPPVLSDTVNADCTDPKGYRSCFPEYKGYTFTAYASSIDEYPDGYFDLVVIDGRSRGACILHAMKKIKTNGILLVDNAERKYYLQPFPELFDSSQWDLQTFMGHVPYNPPSSFDTTLLFTKKEQPTI